MTRFVTVLFLISANLLLMAAGLVAHSDNAEAYVADGAKGYSSNLPSGSVNHRKFQLNNEDYR